jgi:hypothetical protein
MDTDLESSTKVINIPVIFFHGYLVSNGDTHTLTRIVKDNDTILDSGLIFGPFVNNKLDDLCFVSNKENVERETQCISKEIIFSKDNFQYDRESYLYENLSLKFFGNDLYLILKNKNEKIILIESPNSKKLSKYFKNINNNMFTYGIMFNQYNLNNIIIEITKMYNNIVFESREVNFLDNIVKLDNGNIIINYENFNDNYNLTECYLKKVYENNLILLESISHSSDNDTIVHGSVSLF